MDRGHASVTHCDDAVVTVHARDDIDMITARLLHEVLLDAVERAVPHGVAVDLSAVRFIDSVSLAALVTGVQDHTSGRPAIRRGRRQPVGDPTTADDRPGRLWGFTPMPPTAPNEPLTGLTPVG
ncbi:MAG: hypothetical protein JWP76_2021 [Dactylosporangium sp.]|nr:hypothetical protein [Dactylosporangium sp.]